MTEIALEENFFIYFKNNAKELFYAAKTGVFSPEGNIEASILQPVSELKNHKPMTFEIISDAQDYCELIRKDETFELNDKKNTIHVFTDNFSGHDPYKLADLLKFGNLQTTLEF